MALYETRLPQYEIKARPLRDTLCLHAAPGAFNSRLPVVIAAGYGNELRSNQALDVDAGGPATSRTTRLRPDRVRNHWYLWSVRNERFP